MVFIPTAKAPPKAGAKNKVLYSLQWQSKFDPWVYILVFAEAIKAIAQINTDWQVEKAFVDISVFLWLRKQRPRFAQGQTKKELHRTTKTISQMNEMWRRRLRLAQKNCCTVYSRNLIHEFTSLFSPKVFFAGLLRHAFVTLHRTIKAIAQMNADWKVEKAQYAEFNVPTCEHPLKPPMFDSLYRRSWDAKTL